MNPIDRPGSPGRGILDRRALRSTVLLVFLLVIVSVSGCTAGNMDPKGGPDTPIDDASWSHYESADYPTEFLSPVGQLSTVFTIRDGLTDATMALGSWDLESNKTAIQSLGTRPGQVDAGWVWQAGGAGYAVFNMLPTTGGSVPLNGWMGWAVHDGKSWVYEEAPIRWLASSASGMAMTPQGPMILRYRPMGWYLSTLTSTGWVDEPFLGLSGASGAIAANDIGLFIAGWDSLGDVVLWARPWGASSFTATALISSTSILRGGTFAISAQPESIWPTVLWTPATVPTEPNRTNVASVAVWYDDTYRLISPDDEGWFGTTIASDDSASYVITKDAYDGSGSHLWRISESTPRLCLTMAPQGAWTLWTTTYGPALLGSRTVERAGQHQHELRVSLLTPGGLC